VKARLLAAATGLVGCMQMPADAQSAAPLANGELGHFVVTGVLIDSALDNIQQRYFADDPRLLGRLLTVEAKRVAIDGNPACTQVQRHITRRSIAELLRARSQRRGNAATKAPGVADFGLKSAPANRIAMVEYRCAGPDTGQSGGVPGHEWSGATGFTIAGTRRALLWDDEVILILQRATAATMPKPSFACATPADPTERTVCADPALAGWDRSVAAAYRLGLDGDGTADGWQPADDRAALEQNQRDWLAERNRCGANRDCLLDNMYARTDALMRRQY
jgi:uncharacterized protein YecT (DUF1311 family)